MTLHNQAAYHIQRELAGPASDTLAVAGKLAVLDVLTVAIGNGDPDRANGFLLGTSGGTGDAGDAHSNVSAANLANVFRERHCDFFTYGAVGFDQSGRHVGEESLQIVGIHDRSAKKES